MFKSPANFAQDVLRKFNEDIFVTYANSFYYASDENVIYIGLNQFGANLEYQEEMNEIYDYLLQSKGYDYKEYCSRQTFLLLHEMGHAQTLKALSPKVRQQKLVDYVYNSKALDTAYENGLIDYETLQEYHMEEELEEMANNWTMRFLEHNTKLVKHFDELFLKLMETVVE